MNDLTTLTLHQLYALHSEICAEHIALHHQLVGPDYQPLIDPLSDEWTAIDIKARRLTIKSDDVYAMIKVREAERDAARSDA